VNAASLSVREASAARLGTVLVASQRRQLHSYISRWRGASLSLRAGQASALHRHAVLTSCLRRHALKQVTSAWLRWGCLVMDGRELQDRKKHRQAQVR
ncbi:unnamed protein product, partial [Chrysoparadoxa australica]